MAAEAFRDGSVGVGGRRGWPRRQSEGAPGLKLQMEKEHRRAAAGWVDASPPDDDPAAALVAPADPQKPEGFVCFKPRKKSLVSC